MGNAVALLLSPARLSDIRSFSNIEGNLIGEDCGMLSRGIASTPFHEYCTNVFPSEQMEFLGHPQFRFEHTTAPAVHKSAQSLVALSDSGELLTKFTDLSCKKRYFWGEENAWMPILQKLDGDMTEIIHQSGHSVMTDNPGEFFLKLAGFIDL